ncbi:MAG: SpoIIIAH-like family protein [Oscillibacter sp.]|nr:SpoIIIAH-like family protein [Oscillibacter sp.]
MSNQWKRNAVVATVLLFVCAAVYLNWRYAGDVANGNDAAPTGTQTLANDSQDQENDTDGGSTTKVLGDAALVGGVPTTLESEDNAAPAPTSSYFDTARLSRQQSRDNALSLLREASAQENVEQSVLDDANQTIQTLASYTALEGQIENLVVAKGYADCVTFMGENSISVVVAPAEDGLQMEDVAKITDIILRETSYSADQITIMEAE